MESICSFYKVIKLFFSKMPIMRTIYINCLKKVILWLMCEKARVILFKMEPLNKVCRVHLGRNCSVGKTHRPYYPYVYSRIYIAFQSSSFHSIRDFQFLKNHPHCTETTNIITNFAWVIWNGYFFRHVFFQLSK